MERLVFHRRVLNRTLSWIIEDGVTDHAFLLIALTIHQIFERNFSVFARICFYKVTFFPSSFFVIL